MSRSSTTRHLGLGAGVALMGVLVFSLGALAQDDGRVLHEYFNPWDLGDGLESSASPGGESDPSGQAPPSARSSGAGEPPPLSVNPSRDEVVYGADGPVDSGSTSTPYGPLNPGQEETTLDADTDRVDNLSYYANFEPSIMPYKRGVVQNAVRVVDGAYRVRLESSRERSVRIGASARPDSETFWGTFMLRAVPGRLHPLPSVAAGQRVLEIQAEPDVSIDVRRDEADNYYIRTDHEGILRLNIKLAASRFYFDGRIQTDVRWSDLESSRTPALPTQAQDVASSILKTVGVSRSMSPHEALEALVSWYRDFEARPFPEELEGRDLLKSVSEKQIGVCRHRSLAFMVAARSLGIPTRYVYNEAHAFVEVHWPDQGWRRIDLGGAANDFNFSSRSSGSLHDASFNDTFPQPPNYVEELQRQADPQNQPDASSSSSSATEAPGDRSDQPSTEPTDAASAEAASGQAGDNEHASSDHQPTSPMDGESDGAQATPDQIESTRPDISDEASDNGADRQDMDDNRSAVRLQITSASREAFRGRGIKLSGRLRERSGAPISGAAIQVILGPVGASSVSSRIVLGTSRTNGRGRFEGTFSIPKDVSIGRWSVMVRYAGSRQYRSAIAD